MIRNAEHYRDIDYTEEIPDDGRRDLLEQQLADKEREKRKSQLDPSLPLDHCLNHVSPAYPQEVFIIFPQPCPI